MSTSCMKRKVAWGGGGGGGGGGHTAILQEIVSGTLPIKFRACNRFSGF